MNDTMNTAQATLAASRAARQITTEPPTAALVPANGMTALQVVEHSAALDKLGETFAASGFFGAVTKSTATAALINCFIEGLSPVEYKAKYHIMNDGSTSIKSDYAQRNFRRLGGRWHFNEWTAEVCDVTFTYEGEETRGRVTLDEFKANGVAIGKNGLKDNWRKFPREMLKARCLATYIRAICPEALEGQYTQEEVQDFDRAPAAPRVIAPSAVSPSPVAPLPPPAPAPAPKKRKASAPKAEPVDADVVEPTAKPADPAPAPAVDAEVCPCGKNKGRRFEELPNETLEIILANAPKYPAITEAHRAAIVAVLREREEEG